jgi:hypothetical protein
MRIKIIKSHPTYSGVVDVTRNVAFGLIDSGYAEITKDITNSDEQQAGINHGKPTQLRPYKSK